MPSTLHLGAIHADAAIARIGRMVYAVVPAGRCDPAEAAQRIRALAASFVARIGHRHPVVIGVGGPAQSLQGLDRARAEAERTVRVLRDTSPCGRAARLDDVYLEAVLDRLGEVLDDDEHRSYGPIARLISYDTENGTELTGSLRRTWRRSATSATPRRPCTCTPTRSATGCAGSARSAASTWRTPGRGWPPSYS